jgi:hypothetical protein
MVFAPVFRPLVAYNLPVEMLTLFGVVKVEGYEIDLNKAVAVWRLPSTPSLPISSLIGAAAIMLTLTLPILTNAVGFYAFFLQNNGGEAVNSDFFL